MCQVELNDIITASKGQNGVLLEARAKYLDVRIVEIPLFDESRTEVGGADGHPECLHVSGGIAPLFTNILVDVRLKNMMSQLNDLLTRDRGTHTRQVEG